MPSVSPICLSKNPTKSFQETIPEAWTRNLTASASMVMKKNATLDSDSYRHQPSMEAQIRSYLSTFKEHYFDDRKVVKCQQATIEKLMN